MHIWFVSKQLLLKIAVVTKPISKFAIVLKLCYFLISFITHVNLPKQPSYCFFFKKKNPHSGLITWLILRGRLVTWLRVRFTRSHTKCRLVKKKKLLLDGRTHQNVSRTACLHFAASRREKSRTVEHAPVEPCSTVALFTLVNSFFFLWKTWRKV